MKQAVLTSKVSITIMFDLHSLFNFEGPEKKRRGSEPGNNDWRGLSCGVATSDGID